MKINEQPVVIDCGLQHLMGIIHQSEQSNSKGVLIVVGGPQYRVGSHRQFLLLARVLANNGIPVMRFDYRGMGDSSGDIRTFENVNEDIRTVIDVFFQQVPELENVILWGLCDAASAALFYGYSDERVKGMVLLNPWVKTEAGEAKAYLKHYYLTRLLSHGLWKKLLTGQFHFGRSLRSLFDLSRTAYVDKGERGADSNSVASLPDRMLEGLKRFNGDTLIILSGNDLTADQFCDLIENSHEWDQTLKKKSVEFRKLSTANHTFSSTNWRADVEHITLAWVKGIQS